MGQMNIDRNRAQKVTGAARLAAVAITIGGGAVAVFGLPGGRASKPVPPTELATTPSDHASTGTESPGTIPVDPGGIAVRLATVANAPKPVIVAVEPTIDDPGDPETHTELVSDEVSFLGLIREPGRLLALMRVGGRQVVMWEGRVHEGVRVVAIGEGGVEIEQEGARLRVERSEKKGASLNRLDPAPIVPMAENRVMDQNGIDPSREAAIEALRRGRTEFRDRARPIRPPGSDRFRVNEQGGFGRDE